MEASEFMEIPSGHAIFNIGDVGDKMYIILRGSVDIKVPKVMSYTTFLTTLQTFYSGDKFGDLCLITNLL